MVAKFIACPLATAALWVSNSNIIRKSKLGDISKQQGQTHSSPPNKYTKKVLEIPKNDCFSKKKKIKEQQEQPAVLLEKIIKGATEKDAKREWSKLKKEKVKEQLSGTSMLTGI